MNIESLLDRIDLFKKVVIDSGFKRDVEQYLSALSNPETQSNLSSLKDIAVKVHAALQLINESGLEDALDVVRPTVKSFTDFDYLEQLDNLLTDPDIQTPAFANSLRDVLNSLVKQIKLDKTDLDNREIIFQDYTSQSNESSSDAVLAVILKDTDTITGLKKF